MAVSIKGVRVAAREAMMRFAYDPLEQLVKFAQDVGVNNDTKIKIAETLLPYMYPKLSSVTIEGEVQNTTSVEAQAMLLKRVLSDPALADAAQRLSIAAAMAELDDPQRAEVGDGPDRLM